jgi:3-hydroxyisobutyrate dehydrogenase/glyoxylate/succinic semialdehyde reductase
MNIAFIGLGIMGGGMAANLVRAGHVLSVWNRTVEKAAPLVALGAKVASSPVEAVRGAEVVFTMLSTPEAVEEIALGEDGFLPAVRAGAVVGRSSFYRWPAFSRAV